MNDNDSNNAPQPPQPPRPVCGKVFGPGYTCALPDGHEGGGMFARQWEGHASADWLTKEPASKNDVEAQTWRAAHVDKQHRMPHKYVGFEGTCLACNKSLNDTVHIKNTHQTNGGLSLSKNQRAEVEDMITRGIITALPSPSSSRLPGSITAGEMGFCEKHPSQFKDMCGYCAHPEWLPGEREAAHRPVFDSLKTANASSSVVNGDLIGWAKVKPYAAPPPHDAQLDADGTPHSPTAVERRETERVAERLGVPPAVIDERIDAPPTFTDNVYADMISIAVNCPTMWSLIRAKTIIEELRMGRLAFSKAAQPPKGEASRMRDRIDEIKIFVENVLDKEDVQRNQEKNKDFEQRCAERRRELLRIYGASEDSIIRSVDKTLTSAAQQLVIVEDALESERAKYMRLVDDVMALRGERDARVDRLVVEQNALMDELHASYKERDDARQYIAERDHALQNITKERDEARTERDALAERLKLTNESRRDFEKDCRDDLHDMTRDRDALAKERDELRETVQANEASFNLQHVRTVDENTRLRGEKLALVDRLTQAYQERNELRKLVDEQQLTLMGLRKELREMTIERDAFKLQMTELRGALDKQYDALTDARESVRLTTIAAIAERDDLDERLRLTEKERDSAREEAHNARTLTASRSNPLHGLPLGVLRVANVVRNADWSKVAKRRDGAFGEVGDPGRTPIQKAFEAIYRSNELAGEVGELCNVVKKIERARIGIMGTMTSVGALRQEMADAAISLDLLAMHYAVDLTQAVIETFNAKTREVGLNTFIVLHKENGYKVGSTAGDAAFGAVSDGTEEKK